MNKIDTTLVSPLDASGAARRHQRQYQGAALRLARRAKERTYPELMRSQRCRLVVLALEVGGRWSPEAPSSFASSLAAGPVLCLDRCGLQPLLPSHPVGPPCSPSLPPERSVPVSLVFLSPAPPMLMATNPCSARSLPPPASTKLPLLPAAFPRVRELQPWTGAWRTLTSQKTACSCSLHRDRRTPVAKRSVKKIIIKPLLNVMIVFRAVQNPRKHHARHRKRC